MEQMLQPDEDGQIPTSSTDVVSKVLSHGSQFLKNVGLETTCANTTRSTAEKDLQEELEKKRQQSASLRQEIEELKQKSEEQLLATQRELEEVKKNQEESRKRQEETDAILHHLMSYASQSH